MVATADAALSRPAPSTGGANAAGLRRDARLERLRLFGLASPAILLILVILLILLPCLPHRPAAARPPRA